MAEVLGPIAVSTSTMTIPRPQDAFSNPPHLTAPRNQGQRNSMYNPSVPIGFRPNSAGVSPYAFNSTPQLRQDRRKSAGAVLGQQFGSTLQPNSNPYHASSNSSVSTASSSSNRSAYASRDDSVLGVKERHGVSQNRLSANMAASFSTPDLSNVGNVGARLKKPQPPPEMVRQARRTDNAPSLQQNNSSESVRSTRNSSAPIPVTAFQQNMQKPPQLRHVSSDEANRMKRRSMAKSESPLPSPVRTTAPSWSQVASGKHNYTGPLPPPQSRPAHTRTNSGEMRQQAARPHGNRFSTNTDLRPTTAPSVPSRLKPNPVNPINSSALPDRPATAVASASKRQEGLRPNTAAGQSSAAHEINATSISPAVQQLSSLNDKSSSKGVKHRLRRALSFGSSQELRKASAENNVAAEKAKLRKERFANDPDEDAAVAARQEASGLGENIYSSQGRFGSSTDNISMSSTASSASVMLRNLGRGMKRSTRNLRGLFRPKSVVGVPGMDQEIVPSSGVSLVTVEAEREKANINIDPHDVAGGGTGYPKLGRSSAETTSQASEAPGSAHGNRKSIVGNDRERAEVLAAVRKGILKRNAASSADSSPSLAQGELPTIALPGQATPESSVGRRSGESTDGDYFAPPSVPYHTRSTRSLPSRNVSFGPRVSFHDVWSATEYDRRGEIATCNRLTPMLAQQIKEELNTFKMEMEVHEESKPHTHFF